jgi:LCP family protein required for cell wall assembly
MSRYDDPDEAGWQESGPGAPDEPPRRGFRSYSLGARISSILACFVALVLVCGCLFLYVKYREAWDRIKHVDVSSDLQGKRPPEDPNAMNILLIGSDSRSGVNGKIGGTEGISGARSDTVMVLHISPGEHRAVVLSFPRDSVVPILACSAEPGTPGQTAQPAGNVEQINGTFANGGPGCLWKTIEQTTHIYLNDFIELTFIGFEKVIDDLGGVNVCLPAKVDDPMSGLDLSAGLHHVWGKEALAFWRTREDLGEGSDLQRIQRDQFLMAALLQGIEKSGLLTSPTKMVKVIGDATSHLTTNITDVSTMLRVAEGMRGLTSKSVQFVEVPTETYTGNPDWVQWTTQASQLFSAVSHDTRIPKAAKTAKAATKGPGATLDAISPAKVKVDVLNGSGLQGQAAEGSADLTSRGFTVVGSGNASNYNYTDSVVEYSSAADLPAAKTLEAELSNVELVQSSSVTPGTVDLILGSSFTALKAPSAAKTGSSTANLVKTYGGITGGVNVCQDSSAFSGPDGN